MTKLALAASLAAAAAALLLLKKRRKNSHDDEALEELVREARAATRADPRLRAQLRHCLDAASFEEAVGATVAARVADGDVPFRTLRRAFVDASVLRPRRFSRDFDRGTKKTLTDACGRSTL